MRIGPYEVLGEVGRGGMGVVYRARSADGRDVALKVVVGTDQASAFEREVRLLGSFSQADGFVPLIDAGSDRGRRFVVMPFQEGGTLRARFRKGPLGVGEAVAMVSRLAEAMGRAHDRGVVHRDLKPENVLFDARREPLVADLGLAKHFRRDVLGASASRSISAADSVMGTVGYMAPEQVDARPARPQADVFALGAMLYEALTGKRPFDSRSCLTYVAALRETRPEPVRRLRPDAPPWLEAAVARALAIEEQARPVDGRALARLLAGEEAPPRSRIVLGVAGGLLLLLVTLGLLLAGRAPPPPVEVPTSAVAPRDDELARLERLGDDATKAGQSDRAIACYASAIVLAPRVARLHDKQAEAFNGISRFTDGLAEADAALAIDGGDARALVARAWAEGALGDHETSLADSKRAVTRAPANAGAWHIFGDELIQVHQPELALLALDRSLALDSRAPLAFYDRARVHAMLGHLAEAKADLDRSLELAPSEWFALRDRARVRAASGDRSGAIADLDEALRLEPRDGISRDLRDQLRR